MRMIPGAWVILCAACDQDVYYRKSGGWRHEGLVNEHQPIPRAVKCDDIIKRMGITITSPEMDEAIEKASAIIADAMEDVS